MTLDDAYQAKLTGQEGALTNAVCSWLITSVTFVPHKGVARVLGSSLAFTV